MTIDEVQSFTMNTSEIWNRSIDWSGTRLVFVTQVRMQMFVHSSRSDFWYSLG